MPRDGDGPGPVKLEYVENGAQDTPLIRVYDFDAQAASHLRQFVLQLAAGSRHPLLLHTGDGVDAVGGCRLTCKVRSRDEGVRADASGFICVLAAETWAQIADLIEPFCERAEAGSFQYLVQDSDITLLLSVDGRW